MRRENGVFAKSKCTKPPPTYCDAINKAAFVLIPRSVVAREVQEDSWSCSDGWSHVCFPSRPLLCVHCTLTVFCSSTVCRGDTLTSNRLLDAINAGAVPIFTWRMQMRVLPFKVLAALADQLGKVFQTKYRIVQDPAG